MPSHQYIIAGDKNNNNNQGSWLKDLPPVFVNSTAKAFFIDDEDSDKVKFWRKLISGLFSKSYSERYHHNSPILPGRSMKSQESAGRKPSQLPFPIIKKVPNPKPRIIIPSTSIEKKRFSFELAKGNHSPVVTHEDQRDNDGNGNIENDIRMRGSGSVESVKTVSSSVDRESPSMGSRKNSIDILKASPSIDSPTSMGLSGQEETAVEPVIMKRRLSHSIDLSPFKELDKDLRIFFQSMAALKDVSDDAVKSLLGSMRVSWNHSLVHLLSNNALVSGFVLSFDESLVKAIIAIFLESVNDIKSSGSDLVIASHVQNSLCVSSLAIAISVFVDSELSSSIPEILSPFCSAVVDLILVLKSKDINQSAVLLSALDFLILVFSDPEEENLIIKQMVSALFSLPFEKLVSLFHVLLMNYGNNETARNSGSSLFISAIESLIPNVFEEYQIPLGAEIQRNSARLFLFLFFYQADNDGNSFRKIMLSPESTLFKVSDGSVYSPLSHKRLTVSYQHLMRKISLDIGSSLEPTLLLYTLLTGCPSFSIFLSTRSDIQDMIIPILKRLNTLASNESNNYHHEMYLLLICLLILVSDDYFKTVFQSTHVDETKWMHERNFVDSIGLGNLIVVILCKVLLINMDNQRDPFLHYLSLCIFGNLIEKADTMDQFTCQKIFSLLESLGKRLDKDDGDGDIESEEQGIIQVLVLFFITFIESILYNNIKQNPVLVYNLIQKVDLFDKISGKSGKLRRAMSNTQIVIQELSSLVSTGSGYFMKEIIGTLEDSLKKTSIKNLKPTKIFKYSYKEKVDAARTYFIPILRNLDY